MIKVVDLSSMQNIRLGEKDASVLCLGNFDGVHVAHAQLVRRTVLLGDKLSERAKDGVRIKRGAFFFADHTGDRLGKDKGALLTSVEDKLVLFREMGLEIAVIAEFEKIMNMSPEEFVSEILIDECNCAGAVCGYNFRFGKGGEGNADRLGTIMGESRCEIVGEIKIDGDEVSSSAVRAALKNGDVEKAARLLGREFSARAEIDHASGGILRVVFDTACAVPRADAYRVRMSSDADTFLTSIELFEEDGRTFGSFACCDMPRGKSLKIEFIEKI